MLFPNIRTLYIIVDTPCRGYISKFIYLYSQAPSHGLTAWIASWNLLCHKMHPNKGTSTIARLSKTATMPSKEVYSDLYSTGPVRKYHQASNVSGTLASTEILSERRLSVLLQLELHSWLNGWLQWIGQRSEAKYLSVGILCALCVWWYIQIV